MKNIVRFLGNTILGLVVLAAASVTATEGVSPGAIDRMSQVNNACPTFSWGMDSDAVAYDVVAYLLPDDASKQAELTADSEVLFTRVAGSATSWTPSADLCFAPGKRYVWFVRGVSELLGDEVVAAGEWSSGRYFMVPAAPSVDEVARALEVLQRYVAQGGDAQVLASTVIGSSTEAPSAPVKGAGMSGPKSVTTASAAIRGENPEYDEEAYGVVGVTNSVYGAGVAAANTEGGPDLVLDGSYDGVPGAELSEWGLNRPGPTDQTFTFRNTDAGRLHVAVAGDISGHTVDMQELKISGSTVIDDTGEWLGSGDMLPCTGCVASSDIGDGSVDTSDLAVGAVTGTRMADGAVGSSVLRSNAVTNVHLADDAVTGAEIADGEVTYRELAIDSVRSSHIRNGDVGTAELANGAVTSPKILDGTITGADIADEAIGSAKIEDGGVDAVDINPGAVGEGHLAAGSVTAAKIADGAVENQKLGASSVTTGKIYDFSVTGSKIAPSVVDSVHIADGAISTTKIAAGSVISAHIASGAVENGDLAYAAVTSSKVANGTLTASDIDSRGGVYSSRYALYVEDNGDWIPTGGSGDVSVSCRDWNDLPLQGSCGGGATYQGGYAHFTIGSVQTPASYECSWSNNSGSDRYVQVYLVCIEVS